MQEEIWKDIVIEKNGILYDFTNLYKVSNLGRIKSYVRDKNGKIMSPKKEKSGYMQICLRNNGEKEIFKVHRLVATAFLPNPDKLPQVNHKDENKTNNNVDNLEWCSASYNTNYGTRNERDRAKKVGKKATSETKAKISKGLKGKMQGENNPMHGKTGSEHPKSKKVICIETKQIFVSLKEAQEWIQSGNVYKCLRRGKSSTAGGYHWMYYEDWLKLQDENKN